MDAYGESPEQFATLAVPSTPGPHPVVVLIHGGFWRAAYGLDLMEPLAGAAGRARSTTWRRRSTISPTSQPMVSSTSLA